MKISGLQKLTLLDYPGKVACTVFLGGCNYRCPFCHNSELLDGDTELMTQQELLSFLSARRGLTDAVCISGGEPTLAEGLEDFLKSIRAMGYSIKLDTNGTRPDVLAALLEKKLVDYVAMDIKNAPDSYAETAGVANPLLGNIAQSVRLLMEGDTDYEFRTTVVKPLHNRQSVEQMGKWLSELVPGKKPKRLFLQPFADRDTVLFSGLEAPDTDELLAYRNILAPFVQEVQIRGTST